jgi:hypothetical protein
MPMPAHIRAAHKHCSNHRDEIMGSDTCGCFYCLRIFEPSEITTWAGGYIDENGRDTSGAEPFALCPGCRIDSVVGSASGLPITKEFLTEMRRYWFALVGEDPDEPAP